MKRLHWSIADLNRQQIAVDRLALRAELDRRDLHAARVRVVRNIRVAVSRPLAIGGCLLAGVAFGGAAGPLAHAAQAGGHRLGSWSVFAAKALLAFAPK